MAGFLTEVWKDMGVCDAADLAGLYTCEAELVAFTRDHGIADEDALLGVHEWRTAQTAVRVIDEFNATKLVKLRLSKRRKTASVQDCR